VSSDEDAQDGAATPSSTNRPEPLGADFIIPVLACALTAYYLATTVGLAWEAKVTGVFIGAVLVPLCAVHMARMGLRIPGRDATFGLGDLIHNNHFNRQRLGLTALVGLYIASIEWVGTTPGLFLLLVGCMLLMGVRSVKALFGVALATTAVVHLLLIYLLNSRLPRGVIENLLGSLWGAQ